MEGVDDLRWEDTQKLKKYVEGGVSKDDEEEEADGDVPPPAKAAAAKAGSGDYAVENAKSSRATCKSCNEKIMKGDVSALARSSLTWVVSGCLVPFVISKSFGK